MEFDFLLFFQTISWLAQHTYTTTAVCADDELGIDDSTGIDSAVLWAYTRIHLLIRYIHHCCVDTILSQGEGNKNT